MRYEPHGQVNLEDQWINPWFNLIGWAVIILCIWYNQSYTIKKMTYKLPEYEWEKPVKIEMSWSKRCIVIFKCLAIDVKNNPRYTLACCTLLIYLLIRCFL